MATSSPRCGPSPARTRRSSSAYAATGRQVSVEGMNFYRLADGRITEAWTQFDGLGLMQQLGAIPS